MRTSFLFVFAAAVTACSDPQQPTSPMNTRSAMDGRPAGDAGLVAGEMAPNPGLKPVDQVGFTKIAEYSTWVTVPAGQTGAVQVACPAGSVPTGGGYQVGTGGTAPVVFSSRRAVTPSFAGWGAAMDNRQAGAAEAYLTVFAMCAS